MFTKLCVVYLHRMLTSSFFSFVNFLTLNLQPLMYAQMGCILDMHPLKPHLNCIPTSDPGPHGQNIQA